MFSIQCPVHGSEVLLSERRIGAVVVNVNPIYTARELLNVATDSGAKMLLTKWWSTVRVCSRR